MALVGAVEAAIRACRRSYNAPITRQVCQPTYPAEQEV
ncbi:MAG: hypothetical protein FD135_578 [Comamonadaceae bacterium]|nr:MAG: hypothetical protein FD135_578 [Comamonadaceae bacterium]